jgi:hypothetical protein
MTILAYNETGFNIGEILRNRGRGEEEQRGSGESGKALIPEPFDRL